MKDVQWDKYKDDSLEFMLAEGKEMLNGVLESFRTTANRVYALMAVYSSMVVYGFNELDKNVVGGAILILGGCFCIYKVYGYLKTNKLKMKGSEPKMLAHEYFENRTENQRREMIIAKLESLQNSIDENLLIVKRLNRNFNFSLKVFAVTLLLFGCTLGWFAMCFPTSVGIRSYFGLLLRFGII